MPPGQICLYHPIIRCNIIWLSDLLVTALISVCIWLLINYTVTLLVYNKQNIKKNICNKSCNQVALIRIFLHVLRNENLPNKICNEINKYILVYMYIFTVILLKQEPLWHTLNNIELSTKCHSKLKAVQQFILSCLS